MPASLSLSPTTLEDCLPPLMDPADVADHIAIMRIQEETTYLVRDYLAESVGIRKDASKPVDADCRVKMCEWCYQVVDFCKFRRETVAIGMSFLDRYLCTPKGRGALCNRKEYQLAAMTALYIAIKIHEPLEMETSLLADLSRGCYTEMEFVGMEDTMLLALRWRLNGPTPLGFVQYFIALLPESVHPSVAEVIMDYARYQTELAVSEHTFVGMKPSDIALASVLNAMEGMDTAVLPLKVQGKFVRNIERFAETLATEVEDTQASLSLLLVGLLSGDYSEIVGPLAENERDLYTGDEYKSGQQRNSPVSVVR